MSKYYFVGSGIAALAGAAYLIRDGNFTGPADDRRIAGAFKSVGENLVFAFA